MDEPHPPVMNTAPPLWQIAGDLLKRIKSDNDAGNIPRDEIGRKLDQWCKLLNLSPADVAKTCVVSLSTYYRWINKGARIPRKCLDKLDVYIKNATAIESARDSIVCGDHLIIVRSSDQLLARQRCCNTIWSLKNMLPFRAAAPGSVQSKLFKLLSDNIKIRYNCIFYSANPDETALASKQAGRRSFGEFKRHFYNSAHDKEAACKLLRGWQVLDTDLAFELGLSNNFLSVYIFEYDPKLTKNDRELAHRDLDIFYELPLAIYQHFNPHELENGEEVRWLELSPDKCREDWYNRREKLIKLVGGEFGTRAKEILPTKESIKDYEAHLWLHS